MVVLSEHRLHTTDELMCTTNSLWDHQEMPIDHVSDFKGKFREKGALSNRTSILCRFCGRRTSERRWKQALQFVQQGFTLSQKLGLLRSVSPCCIGCTVKDGILKQRHKG